MQIGQMGAVVLLAATMLVPDDMSAQPLTYRTPNIQGTWVTSPWNLNFAFNHRFRIVGNDADITDIVDEGIVDNAPTFNLALGLWSPFMAGVQYGSNPAIRNENSSNEWFPYLKVAPWRYPGWSVSFLGGYNSQAESVDGEVGAQLSWGRFEFLGAVRGFSDALKSGEAGLALAGGLGFRLTNFLSLAGDYSRFAAGPDTTGAWSAGLQMAIPFTPHTFSLQVSNSAGTTPQEASFGGIEAFGGDLTWGFEFTVPFSGFARWNRIFDPVTDDDRKRTEAAPEPQRVVEIEIRQFRFETDTVRVTAGTTVRWVNRDPLAHTSTAENGEWGSPLIGPGETFTVRFDEDGTYPYYCTPHPFMRGAIIVEPRGTSQNRS
jgi:amicyanin